MARIRLAILITLLAAGATAARIITVDDNGPADFNNIQAAIDDAYWRLESIADPDDTYNAFGNLESRPGDSGPGGHPPLRPGPLYSFK